MWRICGRIQRWQPSLVPFFGVLLSVVCHFGPFQGILSQLPMAMEACEEGMEEGMAEGTWLHLYAASCCSLAAIALWCAVHHHHIIGKPSGVSHISYCPCRFSCLRPMCPPHHLLPPWSLWQLQPMFRRAPGSKCTVVVC